MKITDLGYAFWDKVRNFWGSNGENQQEQQDQEEYDDKDKILEITIDKDSLYHISNYTMIINEFPRSPQLTFKEYVRNFCLVDGTIEKDKDIVIKIDNNWDNNAEEEGVFYWIKDKFWSYWNFDKTHKVLAGFGGDYSDCIFIDNGKETTYNELLGDKSGYGVCKNNEDGTNDRFKCQKIGMAIISVAVGAGFVPYSGIVGGVFGVGAGVVIGNFALDKYKDTTYPEGYINSYMGDKLAELGALALKTGVCTVDGVLKAAPLATTLAVALGAVYPVALVLGGSSVYEGINGLQESIEELRNFDLKTNTGKTPEAIYRESVEQAVEIGNRIWPTYGKVGCSIVLGALGFAVGAFAIPALLGTTAISVIIAGIAGTILGTLGATSGYIYNKEISEFLGQSKDWLSYVGSKIVGAFLSGESVKPMSLDNLGEFLDKYEEKMRNNSLDMSLEDEKQKYIDLIISERKQKDQVTQYVLNQDWKNIDDDPNSKAYGKVIPTEPEPKFNATKEEGYDPTDYVAYFEVSCGDPREYNQEKSHESVDVKEEDQFYDALNGEEEKVVHEKKGGHVNRLNNKKNSQNSQMSYGGRNGLLE